MTQPDLLDTKINSTVTKPDQILHLELQNLHFQHQLDESKTAARSSIMDADWLFVIHSHSTGELLMYSMSLVCFADCSRKKKILHASFSYGSCCLDGAGCCRVHAVGLLYVLATAPAKKNILHASF